MQGKKIQLLTLDFPPIEGGISRYLYGIVKNIPSNQISVIGVNAPGGKEFDRRQKFEIERLKVPFSWKKFQRQLKFFAPFYFGKLMRKSKVSFILCGQAHYSVMLPAWIASKSKRIPFGVFTFGLDLLYPQTTKYKKIFNYILNAADVVFADSTAAKHILLQLNISPEKIQVVHPSVDTTPQQLDEALMTRIKEQNGLLGKKCILTVGRLIERKGHDVVLQALTTVIKSVPQIHYLIVGRGANEPHLRTLVHNLQLEDYVTFVGFVPDEELATYYAICDVFVMVSREIPEEGDVEGFGIVYLEANLMSKPVVAGRSGGVPDAVLHKKTGLLVNPTNVQDVVISIIQLLNNQELADRLGKMGCHRVLTEFSSESSTQKVLSALQKYV